jgi:hypothetical protein
MMLEDAWQTVAELIVQWLDKHVRHWIASREASFTRQLSF